MSESPEARYNSRQIEPNREEILHRLLEMRTQSLSLQQRLSALRSEYISETRQQEPDSTRLEEINREMLEVEGLMHGFLTELASLHDGALFALDVQTDFLDAVRDGRLDGIDETIFAQRQPEDTRTTMGFVPQQVNDSGVPKDKPPVGFVRVNKDDKSRAQDRPIGFTNWNVENRDE